MKKVLTLFLVFALSLTLASCTNKEDLANAEEAAQKLSLEVTDPTQVTSDITLPADGLNESTITWESDTPAVITAEGVVTRPAVGAETATVKLTATVKVGDETATKEFTFKVLAAVPSAAVTVKKFESAEVATGDVVELTGIVTGIINTYGFQIYDGTGFGYVHENQQPTVSLGDEVTALGTKGVYNGSAQLAEPQSIEVLSTGNDLPEFTEVGIDTIFAQPSATTDWYNDMFNSDAYVVIQGEHSNAYLTWFTQDLDLLQMEVYYKSGGQDQIGEIKALEGKKVNVDYVLKDFSYGSYRLTVNTNSEIAEEAIFFNAEKVKLAVAFNDLFFNTLGEEIVTNLSLPEASEQIFVYDEETEEDVALELVWTSSNTDVIANDGTVTLPVGTTEDVELTVTATIDKVSASKTYTVTVADADTLIPVTVAEALTLEDGTSVLVEGVVTGMRYGKPFIQDADGTAMFIYTSLDVEVGDKVIVQGQLATFAKFGNALKQVTQAVLVKVVSQDNAVTYNTTMTPAELAQAMSANHSTAFTMTLKWLETDGGYYYFEGYVDAANADNNVRIKMDTDWFDDLATYLDGNSEIEVSFVFYDVHYDEARIVPVAFPGLTNAQKLAIVQGMIEVTSPVEGNLNLKTEFPLLDATITWTSTNAAIDPATGTVTRPEVGEADATGNLVAAVVIGTDAAVESTFAVTVPAVLPPATPDLMITEYVEGSSNNKALELYNPTDATIDLTDYVVNVYSNGSTDAGNTLNLTGTLAPGEVYVICNSGLTDKTACDVEATVTYFNGNDAVELTKAGVTIDLIGIIGNDSNFAAGVTLRRNPDITAPNTVFTIAEWTELAEDTLDGLGSHTVD